MVLTARQKFFIERLSEFLHVGNLDSYRVRTHNVHTLILELHTLIEQWRKGNIKQFETIQLSARETKDKIENDKIYLSNFPFRHLLPNYLENFAKDDKGKNIECLRIQQLLEKVLYSTDSGTYIKALFEELTRLTSIEDNSDETDEVLEKDLTEIDIHLSSLCTELIFVGFSKTHLYHSASIFSNSSGEAFNEMLNKFIKATNPTNLRKYIIIFRLNLSKMIKDLDLPELLKTFPDKYRNEWLERKRAKFIKCQNNQRYFVSEVDALDEMAALKLGKEVLSKYLDKIHFSLNHSKIIPDNTGIIFENKGSDYIAINRPFLPILDGVQPSEDTMVSSKELDLNIIADAKNLSPEVLNRLTSALRHLRIGDNDTEIEQRFINYWIALEFIFSTPAASDSTYRRIKENIISILISCYGKRNLSVLNQQIKLFADTTSIPDIWEIDAVEKIPQTIELPILLKYRLHRYKNHLLSGDKKKIASYLEIHKRNITWQIARIYRLRNELIHEAAIKQDIESLTSNLRYYLIFVLNRAVFFFKEGAIKYSTTNFNMESFFMHYELIRLAIEKNHCLMDILKYGDVD